MISRTRISWFAACFIVLAPASALAGPRWCYTDQPNAIFCDDVDRYCVNAPANPNEACDSFTVDGCTKNNVAARAVWVSLPDGYQVNIDECNTEVDLACGCGTGSPGFVTTVPFALGMPNQDGGKLGHQTVGLTTRINDKFGGSADAVAGTDANPLILDFIMNGQTTGKIDNANTYFELALNDPMGVNERAPTDYVKGPNCATECGGPDDQWQMICQQDVPPTGCPDIAIAPHHASIAVGAVAFLDKDPCHCSDPLLSSPTNEHLAVFDGYKWWTLPGAFTGEGDFVMRDLDNIIRLTITTSMIKVEMTAEEPEPDEYSWCDIPRDYLGAFNKLHLGFGLPCMIDLGTWVCANEPTGDRRYRYIQGAPGAGRPVFDNIALYGGEGVTLPAPTGACCLTDGSCTDNLTEYECETEQGGIWQGPATVCLGMVCCPEPYADTDADGDVDLKDFGMFQACFTGSGGSAPAGCECFDKGPDGFADGDIDADDFTAFEYCWTGPTIPFFPINHPNCPPTVQAELWMHEDFEAYNTEEELYLHWLIHYGAGCAWYLYGGIDGPKCIGGAKAYNRRNYHDLVHHIQVAPGGAGKTSANGTNEAPLVLEAAYYLATPIDTARTQSFWLDLAKGMDNAPHGPAGIGPLYNVLAFGANATYTGLPGAGYREGLMYFDGQDWYHLTTLKHGEEWNYLTVVIRSTTVQFTYYDEAMSNGIQHTTVPRTYMGDFDTMGAVSDDCPLKVKYADGFKLSGGVFLPE